MRFEVGQTYTDTRIKGLACVIVARNKQWVFFTNTSSGKVESRHITIVTDKHGNVCESIGLCGGQLPIKVYATCAVKDVKSDTKLVQEVKPIVVAVPKEILSSRTYQPILEIDDTKEVIAV